RDQPQRRRRAGRAGNRSDARHRPRPAYFVAPPLAFDAFRISSISTVSLRPTAAAAAFPASFTARPARLLVVPSSRARLLKPCSASAARAAVAATATSSAANGLCNSLMNASPVLSDERRPPPLLRRSPTARDFGALLARALGLPADFVLPVAFLAIFYLLCSLGFRRLTHLAHRRIRKRLCKGARIGTLAAQPALNIAARSKHHWHRLGMNRADNLVRFAGQESHVRPTLARPPD